GRLVTLSIDWMVAASRALHLSATGVAAKLAEQVIALFLWMLLGTGVGTIVFAALERSREPAGLLGSMLGGIVGGLVLLVEGSLSRLAPGSMIDRAWIFSTAVAWGWLLGWSHDRLRAPQLGTTRSAVDGRRRFLINAGGAAALVTGAATLVGLT